MRRRRSRPDRAGPDPALLLGEYLADAGLMLRLHRAGARPGHGEVELPKTLLEMVRCLALVRRLDPRDESPGRQDAHAALWRDLLATETLPPGPALDRQLDRLAGSWAEFARVTGEELLRAGGAAAELGDQPGPGRGDRAVGTTCAGSTHSHPMAVQARLRHRTPCPGLVDAAAKAFAPV